MTYEKHGWSWIPFGFAHPYRYVEIACDRNGFKFVAISPLVALILSLNYFSLPYMNRKTFASIGFGKPEVVKEGGLLFRKWWKIGNYELL